MTARTGTREGRCGYCGAKTKTGITVCANCNDLPAAEPLAICTIDETCTASADQHQPECPVEQALKAEFGF